MTYSRVKKYQELRDGLKDEAGINRERVYEDVADDGEDDFLSFMKEQQTEKVPEHKASIEDTLTEPKTFEQMREESSKEIEEALKSAKESVGKEARYNTRMDILSKIREPEKHKIKIDAVDEYTTAEYAEGMFLNPQGDEETAPETEEVKEPEVVVEEEQDVVENIEDQEEPKEELSLMERLAAMSPEEDAKKAEAFMKEELESYEIPSGNSVYGEIDEEDTQVENEEDEQVEVVENVSKDVEETEEDNQELDTKENDGKVVKVLNALIIVLIIAFLILLGVIVYQSFF